MILREALDTLDTAASALDAAWRNAADAPDRRDRLRVLIKKNDMERIVLIERILAGNQAQYRPLSNALGGATDDLRWARETVEQFAVTAGQAAVIVAWAGQIIALL